MKNISHLTLPKSIEDVKAVRVYFGMNQKEFGVACGYTEYSQNSLEKKRHEPKKEFLQAIANYCISRGIKFHTEGGFRVDRDIVQVFEGEDCFLKLIDNILENCKAGDEVLFLGNDDRKSTKKVIAKDNELYQAGIYPKYLVEKGNNFILGPIEDYEQVDKNCFLSNNVVVIYGNKVAFPSVINKEGISTKTIVINDEGISSQLKKYFYFLWKIGDKITNSDVKQVFLRKE